MNYETQVLGDSTIIMDGDDRRRSRKKLIIGAGIAVALVAAAVAISMRGGGDTAAAPAPGSKYMIRRDQTLWQIAQSARPEGTSIHQTMLDIQRLNPDAFIDGNINRIKAGYIIYLPSADDISSGNVDQALAVVEELKPTRTYLTHIAHDLDHEPTNAALPDGVELAYDGLVLELH